MMASAFKTIGLVGRYRDQGTEIIASLKVLLSYLEKHQYKIIFDEETTRELRDHSHAHFPLQELGAHCDLIIVVGGDGSLLNAARYAAPHGTPVLGINRGRLGFLTDIHPDNIEKEVTQVLEGHYIEEARFLLQSSVNIDGQLQVLDTSLNDVVLSPGSNPHMIEFDINIDHQFVCKQRADGLIIATPTGSTAYALSGGGPILHPQLDAIALVPMFPHTLSSRPIVVAGNSHIEILITSNNEYAPKLSCDGHAHVSIPPKGKIIIQKYPHPLRLIHPKHYHYFETLRTKLGWEKHH
jgi:NAD+ kinase